MAEIVRLTESSDWIDLGFVQRERTPKPLMELGIRLHVAGLSLSNTISELEKFGVQRTRKAVHDWVHKADLQPNADRSTPNHVALDRDRNSDRRRAVLAVQRGRSSDQRNPSRTALPRQNDRSHRAVSGRTPRETRRRRHRVSHRWLALIERRPSPSQPRFQI